LALVYEFMDILDLREYLRNNKDVGRRERFHRRIHSSSHYCQGQLLEIARGVEYVHDLAIVHGNFKIVCPFLYPHFGHALTFLQKNILVDVRGRTCVAGLGVALLLAAFQRYPPCPRWTLTGSTHGTALNASGSPNTGSTNASGVYVFGALVWEVNPVVPQSAACDVTFVLGLTPAGGGGVLAPGLSTGR
jgi:serine/threonine protein kinase